MKDNKYEDPDFFAAYGNMMRSQKGLQGAGEWHALKQLLPDFNGRRVLDLGCGYGWHCRYAVENGAVSVTGIDSSARMLEKARSLLCRKIYQLLSSHGVFVFSVEHPIFTAYGNQDWIYDSAGNKIHWPVDHYFQEGTRKSIFLGQEVIKYHRTLDTYINGLLGNGFDITGFVEPTPGEKMLAQNPDWREELRRPMMLIISGAKKVKNLTF